jgi:hypothetical protein
VDIIAVDWSGRAEGAHRHIWLARVQDGELVELRNGRSRHEVMLDLVAERHRCPGGLAVGLDFAFSFPSWFLGQLGYADVGALWRGVAAGGEQWLADCAPPFWGRPGCRRPALSEHRRRTERSATVAGISAKSVFQVGGAGAVGTGSVRGMPYLPQLRRAGFSIWPFDPPSSWKVLEIYPRLLTGPVHKRRAEDRVRYLSHAPWAVAPEFARAIEASEDAFDAAVSALAMADRLSDLASLDQATDPVELLEGTIWPTPNITV